MLNILLELDGVVFTASRLELLPEPLLDRLASFVGMLNFVKCPDHGPPSGIAHVDVRALTCTLDEPCCANFAAALKTIG